MAEWSIRITLACKEGVSKRRAEQIAQSVQRYAEQRLGVSHAYEREVYDLETLDESEES